MLRRIANASVYALLFAGSFAYAAELTLMPPTGEVSNGDLFEVALNLRTDSPVSAAEATLSYNPLAFSIESIDTAESILVSWPTQPLFSNDRGIIKFSGSTDAPFSGNGLILKLRLRALSNGAHELRFDDAVALSSEGSNIISALSSGIYRVEPARREAPSAALAPDIEPVPEPEEPYQLPTPLLEAPGELSLGERIIVKGLVIPDVLVHVFIKTGEDDPVEYVVPSAGDGSFTYVSDFRAEERVYRVWAQTEGRGMRSEDSATISYTVRPLGLAAAAATAVEVLTFMVPLIALTVLLGLIIAFVMHRRRF